MTNAAFVVKNQATLRRLDVKSSEIGFLKKN
jgi:hypothetical protein